MNAIDIPGVSACSACIASVVQGPEAMGVAAVLGPLLWLLVRFVADEVERRAKKRLEAKKED